MGIPYFGVLIIGILLFRVLYWGSLFSETLIYINSKAWFQHAVPLQPGLVPALETELSLGPCGPPLGVSGRSVGVRIRGTPVTRDRSGGKKGPL